MFQECSTRKRRLFKPLYLLVFYVMSCIRILLRTLNNKGQGFTLSLIVHEPGLFEPGFESRRARARLGRLQTGATGACSPLAHGRPKKCLKYRCLLAFKHFFYFTKPYIFSYKCLYFHKKWGFWGVKWGKNGGGL